jgi:beta-glucosidase
VARRFSRKRSEWLRPFNPELMKRAAEITAIETRAAGIPWSFSPVLDLGRHPLLAAFLGNVWRGSYLAKVMGVALYAASKEQTFHPSRRGRVESEALHGLQFSAHRDEIARPRGFLRITCANISPNLRRLPVKAGARTIMINSGRDQRRSRGTSIITF